MPDFSSTLKIGSAAGKNRIPSLDEVFAGKDIAPMPEMPKEVGGKAPSGAFEFLNRMIAEAPKSRRFKVSAMGDAEFRKYGITRDQAFKILGVIEAQDKSAATPVNAAPPTPTGGDEMPPPPRPGMNVSGGARRPGGGRAI